MKDTRVAKRYAAALFEVAKRDDILDAVGEDLLFIERQLANLPALRMAFLQPLMTEERKTAMLADLFGDRVTATSLNFLKLLVRKRRADMIAETIEEFRTLLAEHLNVVNATAETAIAMSPEQTKRLVTSLEKITGKKVNLTSKINSNMIGGVVVRIGDYIIDGSVRSRLERLEQHLHGR